MMTKTIDCAGCGASVAYGRLSCPACGALLASVTGAIGPRPRATGSAEDPEADLAPASAASMTSAVTSEPVAASPPASARTSAPLPAPATAAAAFIAAPSPGLASGSAQRSPGPAQQSPGPAQQSAPPRPTVAHQAPAFAAAGAQATAPAWPADIRSSGPGPGPGPDSAEQGTNSTRSWARPLDVARLSEIAGLLILVGAAMATLGFLLPWSRVVIGAGPYGGYLSTWGLASPTHLLVFLAVLALLAMAVVPSRIPAWLAFGVGGLGLGGLLLGLAWPYVVGPLGAGVGTLLVAMAGLALVAGGTLTMWLSRHADDEPAV